MRSLVLLSFAAIGAQAQTIPGAVLAKNEPHHHPAYEDEALRVLRVSVAGHDTTLLHEHDRDYFWIALGTSTIINAKLGAPDVPMTLTDLAVHYTPGRFAHVARNTGDKSFDNITVELLRSQTNPRNLCEPAIDGKPLDCHPPESMAGVTIRPEVATDQLRVSLVTLAPGKAVPITASNKPIWVIALDVGDLKRGLMFAGDEKWTGGTVRVTQPGSRVLRNGSARTVRALLVVGQ